MSHSPSLTSSALQKRCASVREFSPLLSSSEHQSAASPIGTTQTPYWWSGLKESYAIGGAVCNKNVTKGCADCIHALLGDMMIAVLLRGNYEGRCNLTGSYPRMRMGNIAAHAVVSI
jgi:hypothetical protein